MTSFVEVARVMGSGVVLAAGTTFGGGASWVTLGSVCVCAGSGTVEYVAELGNPWDDMLGVDGVRGNLGWEGGGELMAIEGAEGSA